MKKFQAQSARWGSDMESFVRFSSYFWTRSRSGDRRIVEGCRAGFT